MSTIAYVGVALALVLWTALVAWASFRYGWLFSAAKMRLIPTQGGDFVYKVLEPAAYVAAKKVLELGNGGRETGEYYLFKVLLSCLRVTNVLRSDDVVKKFELVVSNLQNKFPDLNIEDGRKLWGRDAPLIDISPKKEGKVVFFDAAGRSTSVLITSGSVKQARRRAEDYQSRGDTSYVGYIVKADGVPDEVHHFISVPEESVQVTS